jgi:uncharacterized membrane protein
MTSPEPNPSARRPSRPKSLAWLRAIGWRTIAGAALLGGIVHIGATLAVPALSRGNAFQHLRETLPANQMVLLPPPGPGKRPLPFMAPDALYAMCRFDVTTAPLTVVAALPDIGWTLSLHSPQGDNFYAMPAQQSRRDEVSLTIVAANDHGDLGVSAHRPAMLESQIESPTLEGLVVIRAPLRGLAWNTATEAALRKATCTPTPVRR